MDGIICIYGVLGIILLSFFIGLIFTKQKDIKLFKKWQIILLCFFGGVSYIILFLFSMYNTKLTMANIPQQQINNSSSPPYEVLGGKTIKKQEINLETNKFNSFDKKEVSIDNNIEKDKFSKDTFKKDMLDDQHFSKESSGKNLNKNNEQNYVDENGKGRIKGNTNKKTGEKIYHIPGSTYYDRTKIEDTERWFKSEEEAIAAGYRAPKR